ncbi:hypothetical protein BJ165DRAFT_343594 [Panaeolus papilionaceus]|nr:hypothetical protein BJ165DRAFT_343594 [Panaeolus papilionaceus]
MKDQARQDYTAYDLSITPSRSHPPLHCEILFYFTLLRGNQAWVRVNESLTGLRYSRSSHRFLFYRWVIIRARAICLVHQAHHLHPRVFIIFSSFWDFTSCRLRPSPHLFFHHLLRCSFVPFVLKDVRHGLVGELNVHQGVVLDEQHNISL